MLNVPNLIAKIFGGCCSFDHRLMKKKQFFHDGPDHTLFVRENVDNACVFLVLLLPF